MKFLRVKQPDCVLMILADKKNRVISAGVFETERDAEAACDFVYTLLVRRGEVKAPVNATQRTKTVADLLGTLGLSGSRVEEQNL